MSYVRDVRQPGKNHSLLDLRPEGKTNNGCFRLIDRRSWRPLLVTRVEFGLDLGDVLLENTLDFLSTCGLGDLLVTGVELGLDLGGHLLEHILGEDTKELPRNVQ